MLTRFLLTATILLALSFSSSAGCAQSAEPLATPAANRPAALIVTLNPDLPAALGLRIPGPNPFSHFVRIQVSLPVSKKIKLLIYDANGLRVHALHEGPLLAGEHTFVFSPDDTLPNGLYFVVLKTPARSFQEPIKLLR